MSEALQVVVHGIGSDNILRETEAFNGVMPCFNYWEWSGRAKKPGFQKVPPKGHLGIVQNAWKSIFFSRGLEDEAQPTE